MAEGGFDNENPILDHALDHDGDDDDDDDEEEVERTRPFQPGTASTPYHNGEAHEMPTVPSEHSGLPETSFDETTHLLPPKNNQTWGLVEALFPDINSQKVDAFMEPKSGRIMVKLYGKRAYYLYTVDSITGEERLNPDFPKELQRALGKDVEEKLNETKKQRNENKKRLIEAERQEKILKEKNKKLQKATQEQQKLETELEKINTSLTEIENEGGTQLEKQNEIDRLKREKSRFERDIEEAKKKSKEYEKATKEQQKATKDVVLLQRKLTSEEQKIKTLEENLNVLREQEADLERQNEEDKSVIEDENTSPSKRAAAKARVEEREEELARLPTQIQERDLPLRERIKEIFKKYGFTVTAVLLAVGTTIGVVVSSLTKGLKSVAKGVGNGLQELGKKKDPFCPACWARS